MRPAVLQALNKMIQQLAVSLPEKDSKKQKLAGKPARVKK